MCARFLSYFEAAIQSVHITEDLCLFRLQLPVKMSAVAPPSDASPEKTRKATHFMHLVYRYTCSVPAGKVSTYALIAKALHSHPRAVGQALRHNPYAPDVPCHRVVATNLSLGGFNGETDLEGGQMKRKIALLRSEGVSIDPTTHLVHAACVHDIADADISATSTFPWPEKVSSRHQHVDRYSKLHETRRSHQSLRRVHFVIVVFPHIKR